MEEWTLKNYDLDERTDTIPWPEHSRLLEESLRDYQHVWKKLASAEQVSEETPQ